MPGAQGDQSETRSLHQRRSGDDEPLPARRGVRDRRRRGDRSRSRPLRAVHRHTDGEGEQPHDGSGLLLRDLQGAAGRLPGQNGAGDPPHHERDQGLHQEDRRVLRCGDRGDRRYGGRHREPALPRGDPPVPQRGGPGERDLHPPDLGPLHQDGGGGEDETDAAQRQGTPGDRHPARHPPVPDGELPVRRHQGEDRALLQRGGEGGLHRQGCGVHLRGSPRLPPGGGGSEDRRAAQHLDRPAPSRGLGGCGEQVPPPRRTRSRSPSWGSTSI